MLMPCCPRSSTLFPYTTLFRSAVALEDDVPLPGRAVLRSVAERVGLDAERRPEGGERSEEHTSELQSRVDLVCRLLLETKTRADPFREESSHRQEISPASPGPY